MGRKFTEERKYGRGNPCADRADSSPLRETPSQRNSPQLPPNVSQANDSPPLTIAPPNDSIGVRARQVTVHTETQSVEVDRIETDSADLLELRRLSLAGPPLNYEDR